MGREFVCFVFADVDAADLDADIDVDDGADADFCVN